VHGAGVLPRQQRFAGAGHAGQDHEVLVGQMVQAGMKPVDQRI
jgi:hypothetical protein